MTRNALIKNLSVRFEETHLPQPGDDARALVCGLLDLDLTDLVLAGKEAVSEDDVARILSAAERRCRHEPVHRILGWRAFYGRDFLLSPETLEPRPDTETLVSAVLPLSRSVIAARGRCRVIDLGTGTGAIGLTLLCELPQAEGTGTDISQDALATARRNAQRLGVSDRFRTICGNWFDAVEGEYDLVVSNPPYIRHGVIATLDEDVRGFDPVVALDGGVDGLDGYRSIAAGAMSHLAPGGHIAVETGYDQQDAVCGIFQDHHFRCLERITDFGGNDRVLIFSRKPQA
ncbi:peptide chain release factor N(5)-glutamine methyltransferase [Hoeflea prorocentri]|nr:peptide chain release factor N(5)-glutamine methyltransferase [Hoeflea prorocentri]